MQHGCNPSHNMEYHPIANVFPLLPDPELRELADDIREHGLKEPIWTYEGKILDGRNRSAACQIAGIEPEIKEFRGTAEEAFRHVWSLNFHRRHMTQSQKGACAADAVGIIQDCISRAKERQGKRTDLVETFPQSDGKKSRDEVGEMFGVSGRYVDDAVAVKRENPELHEKVKSGEITLPQAKREIRIAARNEVLRKMEWPKGKYRVLYADPPWRYEHCKTSNRRIENQYPTMDLDAICNMKISEITTPDAVLFLWATSPKLYEAMNVIDAWGFTYRTDMVWDKERIGMGYYARQQHETLLICTKGSPSVPVVEHRPCSVIRSPREGHSRKPDRFRELIDAMYPFGPRIELFARTKRDGWDVWGNEVQANSETQSTCAPFPQTQG
jgi:N6-adenosine-specific RNA methylase IME4